MISRSTIGAVLLAALALGGCAAPVAQGVHDPYEVQNRRVHEFNKRVDQTLLRPASNGYGSAIPRPVQQGVGNFAGNVATPGYFVNDVLQGNVDDAAHNFARFLINTTIGILGVFDPASDMGLHERGSDFGETLHVWGVGEGAYLELPFLGPSTQRDAVGTVVDLFTNPLGYQIDAPERYALPAVSGLAGVGARYRYRDLVDSVLYDSADSYAQARLLYLDSRRFKLGGVTGGVGGAGAGLDGEIDPYADDTGIDPYAN